MQHLVPGSSLHPIRQDDRIPVLLIQRSITSSNGDTSTLRSLHGWTVIVPKGWGMPFFSSLIHTGTRVAGQREKATQQFEAGCLHFPRDYPGSPTYDAFAAQRGKEERERWERKPPAKRPSWDKLGTRSPWVPDWDVVLGLRESFGTADGVETLVPAQREAQPTEDPNARPWLLKGPDTPALVSRLTHVPDPKSELLSKVNELRAKRGISPLQTESDILLKSALLMVMLHIPRSGSPEDDAVIYELEDGEAQQWKDMLKRDADSARETELSELEASQSASIGYVTSGNFSLSIGQGQAIGAVPLAKLLQLTEQSHRLGFGGSRPLVKFRNKDGNICRVAELEILC